MEYKYFQGILFVVVLIQGNNAGDDEKEEMCECVSMQINGDTADCGSDWDDAQIKMSLQPKIVPGEDDMPDLIYLSGVVKVEKDLECDGYGVGVDLKLQTNEGSETTWSGMMEMCKALADDSAPWSPLLAPLGNNSLIEAGKYEIPSTPISFDFITPYLFEDNIGIYEVGLKVEKGLDKTMCTMLGAAVDMFEMPCKKCEPPSDE